MNDKVQNINNFIEKIMKNSDFSAMLDDKNQEELDFYYELVEKISQNYKGLVNGNQLPEGINGLKVALLPEQCEKLIIDFFQSIGVSKQVIKNCLSIGGYKNLRIEKGLERAYQKDGVIYLPEFTNTFEWLKTAVHEMAHYIRNQNTKGISATFGTYNEVEAKIIEQAFYQYLVNSKQPILIDENGRRPLNQSDIELQNLREIMFEQQNLFRFKDEYWFVKKLRNNFKENGTYFFKEDDYLKLSENEKRMLDNTFKWRENYLPDEKVSFDYESFYSLHNGRHITNEFRFIIARLFSEYAISNPKFLDSFGNYLLNSEIKDKKSLDTFLGVTSYDDLVKNMFTNYTKYTTTYLTSILNDRAKEYLDIIKSMYGKDMSEKQLEYLHELQENNCVIVNADTTEYKNNQLANGTTLDVNNTPLAHGGRVFNDDKIHFYLSTMLSRNPNISFNDITRTFDSLLTHELLHFFIRPKANELKSEVVSNFITEGLVDMVARDINQQTGKLENYQSNYGPNVIFVRRALANVPEIERDQLLFNADIETFLKRTSSEKFNSQKELQKAMTMTTNYDALLSKIVNAYGSYLPANERESKQNSGLRQLYNLSANATNLDLAIAQIRQVGSKYYKEAMPSVDRLINEYKGKNIVDNQSIFKRKREERQEQESHFATMKPEAKNIYQKMQEETKNLNNGVIMAKPKMRILAKEENKESNNNTGSSNSSNGFISILLLSLSTGFASGIVAMVTYLLMER